MESRVGPDMTESEFWSNFARFGSKLGFLTKFLNDSAWLLLQKLKKHSISIQSLNILLNAAGVTEDTFHLNFRIPGPGWGPVRVGARSGLGPIWALMGPPGQVLAGPDMSDFRLLVEFCMFWVQN